VRVVIDEGCDSLVVETTAEGGVSLSCLVVSFLISEMGVENEGDNEDDDAEAG